MDEDAEASRRRARAVAARRRGARREHERGRAVVGAPKKQGARPGRPAEGGARPPPLPRGRGARRAPDSCAARAPAARQAPPPTTASPRSRPPRAPGRPRGGRGGGASMAPIDVLPPRAQPPWTAWCGSQWSGGVGEAVTRGGARRAAGARAAPSPAPDARLDPRQRQGGPRPPSAGRPGGVTPLLREQRLSRAPAFVLPSAAGGGAATTQRAPPTSWPPRPRPPPLRRLGRRRRRGPAGLSSRVPRSRARRRARGRVGWA